jgi:apolipoprotein D and lipocalin family protein
MALQGWQIALIVIGAVLLFLVLMYLFFRWYTWRKVNTQINPTLPRVPINPQEYQGVWFEIARYPVWFEEGCSRTKAIYSIDPSNDRIRVQNQCIRNGSLTESQGWAYPTKHDGVLGVSFFPGIYGNYTVTYRDSNTSIVTNPNKSTLWILSRSPVISDSKRKQLLQWLEKHDFSLEKLQFTNQ